MKYSHALKVSTLILFTACLQGVYAQEDTTSKVSDEELTQLYLAKKKGEEASAASIKPMSAELKKQKVGVSFSGQTRFQARYRVLTENWADPGQKNGGSTAKNLNINGFGDNYGNIIGLPPLLRLDGEVTPSGNTSIRFYYFLNHIMSGQQGDTSRIVFPNAQSFEARGDFNTSFGKFRVFAGNTMIPLSQIFAGWQNPRFYPYYRAPWDWYGEWGGAWEKYSDFYVNNSGQKNGS